MKFLKTFENYEPEPETQNIEQDSPMLRGKAKITEFDLEGLEGGDTIKGDDEMPEGISPLGESRSERNSITSAP